LLHHVPHRGLICRRSIETQWRKRRHAARASILKSLRDLPSGIVAAWAALIMLGFSAELLRFSGLGAH
jgi:hypothetical protein